MLIASSVFHYKFESIHPFLDGNGRMGRLWQTALLSSWRPIFQYIPIESIIKEKQQAYYESIALSNLNGNSNAFVIFMLDAINQSVRQLVCDSSTYFSHVSDQVNRLLSVLEDYPMSSLEIMEKLKLKSKIGFRKNYLNKAIQLGLVGMTEPLHPTSKNQKYYKL